MLNSVEKDKDVERRASSGFPKNNTITTPSTQMAMTLQWTFGLNQNKAQTICHISATQRQEFLLYSAAHTIVMYDCFSKKQKLLQGHANTITVLAVTSDKRWFLSGDAGPDNMFAIWETVCGKPEKNAGAADNDNLLSAYPIKNVFDAHDGFGIVGGGFTSSNRHIVTLGAEPKNQTVAIWDWTTASLLPIQTISVKNPIHTTLTLNQYNPLDFMTLGNNSVAFYTLDPETFAISTNVPEMSTEEFQISDVAFTDATFQKNGKCLVVNHVGDLIFFESKSLDDLGTTLENGEKCAIKYLKVHSGAISFITSFKDFIIMGTDDGVIKIFDQNAHIIFWYPKLNGGGISCITPANFDECMFDDSLIPELTIATQNGKIFSMTRNPESCKIPFKVKVTTNSSSAKEEENPNDSKGTGNPTIKCLIDGQYGYVSGMESIPGKSLVALSSQMGTLTIWDYSSKTVVSSRLFTHQILVSQPVAVETTKKAKKPETVTKPLAITALAVTKTGKTLILGFANGFIKFIDSSTLTDLASSSAPDPSGYKVSNQPILKLAISLDGDYAVFSDSDNITGMFSKQLVKGWGGSERAASASGASSSATSGEAVEGEKKAKSRIEWVFLGRRKTHFKPVVAFLFGSSNGFQTLHSVSEDKHVVTYNLAACTKDDIQVISIRRIDQLYSPTAAALYCKPSLQPEEFIMTFNKGLKCKLYVSETQLCRKTVLGPTFAGVVDNFLLIPGAAGETKYFIFTSGNTLGMSKLPLDGNPYRNAGLIGHATPISHICLSSSNLFSAGGSDGIVNMWSLNPAVLDQQVLNGGEGMEPFLKMLGSEETLNEFLEYFYYAQIKSRGEDVSSERVVEDSVALDMVPSIMAAMGYYPSNQDIDDMINEVRHGKISDGATTAPTDISFNDLIKLYLNHRPVFPITENDLHVALSHAKRLEPGKPIPEGPVPLLKPKSLIQSQGLYNLMGQFGECLSVAEVDSCFKELILDTEPYYGNLPKKFTVDEFVHELVGMSDEQEILAENNGSK